MHDKFDNNSLSTIFLLILAITITGCATKNHHVRYIDTSATTPHAQRDKVELDAVLKLSNKYSNYYIAEPIFWPGYPGIPGVFHMGNALSMYAQKVSRKVFRTVSLDQDNTNDAQTSHKVILVPKLVTLTQASSAKWAWEETETEVVIDWQVYSIKNELIWSKEYIGRGKGNLGTLSSIDENYRERVEQAISNLFEVSLNQLISSPILKQLEVTAPLFNSEPSMNMDLAKQIMHEYIDVNDKTQKGLSLLYYAAKCGNPAILEMVISEGIDVNGRIGGLNTTALYLANEHNNEGCIKILVENGADVNLKVKGKNAQIVIAAVNGKEDVARFLLESGAKVPTMWGESEAIAITSRMAAKYYGENNNKSQEIRHYIISRDFYDKASKEYEETSKEYNKQYNDLKQKKLAKDILMGIAAAFVEWGQQYQARQSAKQMADYKALVDANKMGLSQMAALDLVSQYRSAIKRAPVVTDNRLATVYYNDKSEKLETTFSELNFWVKYYADKSAEMKKYCDEIKLILEP